MCPPPPARSSDDSASRAESHPALERLLDALVVDEVGDRLYDAKPATELGNHLFGGQVLAQGLASSNRANGPGLAHSMHAYFLRAGNPNEPIRFRVELLRASRTFRTYQVVASQGESAILQMSVSYHESEDGPTHQIPMDVVGPPQGEHYERSLLRAMTPKGYTDESTPFELPVEILAVGGLGLFSSEVREPQARCWMRMRSRVPDDPSLHQCLFAYASDYSIFAPAVSPHPAPVTAFHSASLDHAIWFHREFRMDEWVLFELDSPYTGGGRGLGRGLVFTRDGELVGSCVQEGLLRPLR
jgi:acyl-CoA thioesterase-2